MKLSDLFPNYRPLEFPRYPSLESEDQRIEYLKHVLYLSKTGCQDLLIDPWRTLNEELESRRFWQGINSK